MTSQEALLDSYEEERLPVANQLLRGTDRAFSMIVSDRMISRILRTRVIAKVAAFAMRFDRIRKLAFRTISQIGIQYRASSLSETLGDWPEEAPRAGDRFPWLQLKFSADDPPDDLFQRIDDTCFNLMIVGQTPVPSTLRKLELLQVHEIPTAYGNDQALARMHIPIPSFYLLRPDCYVGLAGRHLSAEVVVPIFF